MASIFTVMKDFYNIWNIQGFVLISLLLQTILVLFAPLRKRTSNGKIVFLIWLAYLLADLVANFAIGLISARQGHASRPDDGRPDIFAFWAPFLLLHISGPDTITAFSLEDNALWRRHLVGFIAQVMAAFVVFGQSLPRNDLWVSTILLFVAGTIRYVQRVRALHLANLDRFRESMLKKPNPGPKYARFMREYTSRKMANVPTMILPVGKPDGGWEVGHYAMDEDKLNDLAVVKHAYHFFEIFKGFIGDLNFNFSECRDSRLFFLSRNSRDAFGVLAVELNFLYEVLYTKAAVMYSIFGWLFRFMSWCMVVGALLTFYSIDKHGFHKIDVRITYTLLYSVIGLDALALLELTSSDWAAVYVRKFLSYCYCEATAGRYVLFFHRYFLALKSINWGTVTSTTFGPEVSALHRFKWTRLILFRCVKWAREILFRRWSESLHTYNFIDYCLEECPRANRRIIDHFSHMWAYVDGGMWPKDLYDRMKYVSKVPIQETLWDFIFRELKRKSNLINDSKSAKRICSARGDWVLQDRNWNDENSILMNYVVDVNYDQSLLIWHIATDLCFRMEEHFEEGDAKSNDSEFCQISKILSDYMLYLLVMKPTMMPTIIHVGQTGFRDTCAEAKDFFSRELLLRRDQEDERELAAKLLLEVNTEVKPIDLKGCRSKSVLFDGCILAKELQTLDGHVRWKLMSEVWVELLSYAASHCRVEAHAAQLCKGGELITFVWLLMAHLGIGDWFQTNDGRPRVILGSCD